MKMFVSVIVAVVSFDLEESFCVLNAVLEAFPPWQEHIRRVNTEELEFPCNTVKDFI